MKRLKWYDIRVRELPSQPVFNTVRAESESDAIWQSRRQAYLLGIRFKGVTRRDNPPTSYAVLTPSGGELPY